MSRSVRVVLVVMVVEGGGCFDYGDCLVVEIVRVVLVVMVVEGVLVVEFVKFVLVVLVMEGVLVVVCVFCLCRVCWLWYLGRLWNLCWL